ncbi:hypothetical protein DICA4_D14972 [Diutina catenulata]
MGRELSVFEMMWWVPLSRPTVALRLNTVGKPLDQPHCSQATRLFAYVWRVTIRAEDTFGQFGTTSKFLVIRHTTLAPVVFTNIAVSSELLQQTQVITGSPMTHQQKQYTYVPLQRLSSSPSSRLTMHTMRCYACTPTNKVRLADG